MPCLLCLGVLLVRESEPLRTPHAFSGLHHHPTPTTRQAAVWRKVPCPQERPLLRHSAHCLLHQSRKLCRNLRVLLSMGSAVRVEMGGRVRDLGPHLVLRDHFCLVLQMTQGGYLRPCPGLPAPELESWRTLPAP